MSRLGTLGWAAVLWVLLWGEVSWANIAGGLAAGSVTLMLTKMPPTVDHLKLQPVAAVAYGARFVIDLILASVQVARQVFWPIDRLRPGIIEVPMHTTDELVLTFVANTITLTPGTMTIDMDTAGARLFVHALHLDPQTGVQEVIDSAHTYERHTARCLRRDLDTEVIR
ncbi:MAG: hypothetical protein CSA58_02645 [Micrococcales bacterium]|nr:MAG: hypothetical protein CSB46_01660 [Micrococcales bacterium]PIE27732.1 MAG: hypothetical protein CSA58_02645 [Micrococcales bacterium]